MGDKLFNLFIRMLGIYATTILVHSFSSLGWYESLILVMLSFCALGVSIIIDEARGLK